MTPRPPRISIEIICKILTRINRIALGNFGDCKPLREGVMELRIDFGPGYRVYFAEEAGIARESLYRALSPKGNPRLSTLLAVTKAVGLKLTVEAA